MRRPRSWKPEKAANAFAEANRLGQKREEPEPLVLEGTGIKVVSKENQRRGKPLRSELQRIGVEPLRARKKATSRRTWRRKGRKGGSIEDLILAQFVCWKVNSGTWFEMRVRAGLYACIREPVFEVIGWSLWRCVVVDFVL